MKNTYFLVGYSDYGVPVFKVFSKESDMRRFLTDKLDLMSGKDVVRTFSMEPEEYEFLLSQPADFTQEQKRKEEVASLKKRFMDSVGKLWEKPASKDTPNTAEELLSKKPPWFWKDTTNSSMRISSREPRIVTNAIVLDDASKAKLKEVFPGKHANYSGDHITLDYGKNEYHPDFGKEVNIPVIGYAKDDKCEAVLVDVGGIKCDNRYPHITISTAPGTKPVYSNELLANGHDGVDEPVMLRGKVGSFINGRYVTEKV